VIRRPDLATYAAAALVAAAVAVVLVLWVHYRVLPDCFNCGAGSSVSNAPGP